MILLSSLVFFLKFGDGFFGERESPTVETVSSAAPAAPTQGDSDRPQTGSEDSAAAIAISNASSTGGIDGSPDEELRQGKPVEVDRVGTPPDEAPVRRQRGSGAPALENSSTSEDGSGVVSSDRPERRRPTPALFAEEAEAETSSSGPSIELALRHKPITKARVGSSELVSVRMDAPRSAKVTLSAGPVGGPFKRSRLKAKSGGRWEGGG